ncbi:SAF domain-containing protein [Flavobacterium granuli]|uniref:SAF domain-containing protein n=1 Tax=Flavobacterium granuli TaxID=280093 RepID=A0A1M5QKX7_9FLAO|nr:SAF domain-containing protein [Flavobacterium granuli]SHH14638.1 SAF domain-containing protein [Flavobacterium granuli]
MKKLLLLLREKLGYGANNFFAFATVCAIADIKKGGVFTKENIWVKRPGTGKILAEHFNDLIGKTAARDIDNDEQLDFSDFE